MGTFADVIRRITIFATTQGITETTAALGTLSGAVSGVTVAQDTMGSGALSVAGKLNSLQKSLDAEYASEVRLASIQKTLNDARNQGLISIQRENELLTLAAAKYKVAGESAKLMGESIKTAKEFALGLVGGLGAGAAFAGFAELPKAIMDAVHEAAGLGHVAETIGITTKSLQELQYAGAQFHIGTETMDSALERFSKNLGQASEGSGALSKVLKENHIVVSGNLTTDLLNYSNLIQGATNAEQRNLLITTAFGKNAQELGLLFKDGGAGLQEFMDQADAMGAVLGGSALESAKALDAEFVKMQAQIGVTFKDFAITVAPIITTAMGTITTAVQGAQTVLDQLKSGDYGDALINEAITALKSSPSGFMLNIPTVRPQAAPSLSNFDIANMIAQNTPMANLGADPSATEKAQIDLMGRLQSAANSANPPLGEIQKSLKALIDSKPDVAVNATAEALLKLVNNAKMMTWGNGGNAKGLPFDTTDVNAFNDALGNLAKIGVPALTAAAKAQNDLDAALAHASGSGAGSIDNIVSAANDAKAREAQAAALKEDAAQAKTFTDALAKLNAEAEKSALDKFAAGLPTASQNLLKAAESTGLVHQAMTLFLQDTASDGWMAILRDVGLLTTEMRQLEAATNGAAAAKSSFETTNYSVPNSSGGMSNVQVVRPAGSAAATAASGGGINVIDVNSSKWFAGGGSVSGPGSGTSDSIMARLSNGEFVVNAGAAAKHMSLLNALNDNRLPGFAAGGAVSPSAAQLAALAQIERGGANLSNMTGINVLGSSAIGDTVSTQFSFKAPAAQNGVSANGYANYDDPGLIAFDKAHPNWAREVEMYMETWKGTSGGLISGSLSQLMESFRANHAAYYQNAKLIEGGSAASAYAWASGQGLTALPTAQQAMGGMSINGFPEAFQSQFPKFATGGAILPGTDSQVVKFNKSPDETVGIFTPSQMKAVGDAINNNGHGPITVHFHIANMQMMPDGRLPRTSRAELQDNVTRGVKSALAGGRG